MTTFHDFNAARLDGTPEALSAYQGRVVLVVNVASECGYTPQYAGLQALQNELQEQPFSVLGFPCNQFGAQEPGAPEQIQGFCQRHFGVTFPLFSKVEVKGPAQAPLYAFLAAGLGEPKWNFHKFLVGKEGQLLGAFASDVEPDSAELRQAINAALG